MKERFDELQNKFIDNDLSNDEIKEVNELLKYDYKFRENLEVMQSVDQSLSKIPVTNAPSGLTEKILEKIELSTLVIDSKNYFLKTLFALFISMFTFGFFFILYLLLDIDFSKIDYSSVSKVMSNVKPITEFLRSFVTTNSFRMVIALVGFIILISFYFQIGSFSRFKEKVNNY